MANPGFGWCAWFVRQCAAKAGLDFGSSNVPAYLSGRLGNVDFSSTDKPKVGDLAFIITEGQSTIGHIGIVVAIEDGKVVTMEGNMSGSVQTSKVKKVKYLYSNGQAFGYGRIDKIGRNS